MRASRSRTSRRVPRLRAHLPRSSRRESGQAIVEFAIIVPLFMLVLFGIFKFGTAYNNYIQLSNATDAGARLFSIERGQGTPCSDVVNEVDTSAVNLGTPTVTMTEGGYSYGPTTSASGSCPWNTGGTPGSLVSGQAATLKASIPCDLTLMGVNFAPGCTITVTATEQVE